MKTFKVGFEKDIVTYIYISYEHTYELHDTCCDCKFYNIVRNKKIYYNLNENKYKLYKNNESINPDSIGKKCKICAIYY